MSNLDDMIKKLNKNFDQEIIAQGLEYKECPRVAIS